MRFLADEQVPIEIDNYLKQNGHEVVAVRDVFMPETPDRQVVEYANTIAATIITWNEKDFRRLVARRSPVQPRYQNVGKLHFHKVRESRALARLTQVMPIIEAESAYLVTQTDSRLFVIVANDYFQFLR